MNNRKQPIQLNAHSMARPPQPSDFDSAWNLHQKIVFAINLIAKPATISQVIQSLNAAETVRPVNVESVKRIIYRLHQAGRIVQLKVPGSSAAWYARPHWLDEEGVLMESYRPNFPWL